MKPLTYIIQTLRYSLEWFSIVATLHLPLFMYSMITSSLAVCFIVEPLVTQSKMLGLYVGLFHFGMLCVGALLHFLWTFGFKWHHRITFMKTTFEVAASPLHYPSSVQVSDEDYVFDCKTYTHDVNILIPRLVMIKIGSFATHRGDSLGDAIQQGLDLYLDTSRDEMLNEDSTITSLSHPKAPQDIQ
jgi:hypothetical protein